MKKILFLLGLLPTIVVAQSFDSLKTLSLITVSGTRLKVESNTTTKINLKEVNTTSNFETPFIIESTPSINTNSDNGSYYGYSYLTLRGLTQNKINYTLNGVPLNDGEDMMVYTTNYTNIINSLKSIEVVRGATESNNGISSYGGLVILSSKDLLDSQSTNVSITYGSFKSYETSINYNSGLKNNSALFINYSNTGGDGFKYHSKSKSNSFFGSYGYFKEKYNLKLNVLRGYTTNQQAWLPVPTGMDIRTNLLNENEADNFVQTLIQGIATVDLHKLKLSASIYYNSIIGGYSYSYNPDTLGRLNLNGRLIGSYVNLKYKHKKLELNNGFTLNYHNRRHEGSFEPYQTNLLYSNIGYKSEAAIYSKALLKIKSSIFDYDIQVRNTKLNYSNDVFNCYEVFNYTFLNAKIGYTRIINRNNNFYSSIAINHREPTRTDVFQSNDNVESINDFSNVKPEKIYDFETGLKVNYSKLKGCIDLYAMLFNNEIITYNQFNYLGILLKQNVKKSYRIGIESDFTYKFGKHFNISNQTNISNNKVLINGHYKIPISTPKLITSTSISYSKSNYSFGICYSRNSFGYLEPSNNSNFKISPYQVFDLNAKYSISDKIDILLFINNLFDKPYRSSGNVDYDTDGKISGTNYFWQSGINSYLSLKIKL